MCSAVRTSPMNMRLALSLLLIAVEPSASLTVGGSVRTPRAQALRAAVAPEMAVAEPALGSEGAKCVHTRLPLAAWPILRD